ncbi:MAG: glycosyltransferase [Candidatus Hydrogenedentota bacterium]
MSKVFIFIPTLNEAGNVEELITTIFKIDPEFNILIVDDDSTDGTQEKILKLKETYKNLHYIFRKIRGRGSAQKEAYQYILKQQCDYLIELDADFSHNPSDIPRFLENITDCDMVIGSRLDAQSDQTHRKFYRKILTYLSNFYVKLIFSLPVKDYTSGYRCLRVECLKNIPVDNLFSTTPSILEEILYIFCKRGYRIKEIPICFSERKSGKTKLTVFDLMKIFVSIYRIKRYWNKVK